MWLPQVFGSQFNKWNNSSSFWDTSFSQLPVFFFLFLCKSINLFSDSFFFSFSFSTLPSSLDPRDLGSNSISGTIPTQLGKLSGLFSVFLFPFSLIFLPFYFFKKKLMTFFCSSERSTQII